MNFPLLLRNPWTRAAAALAGLAAAAVWWAAAQGRPASLSELTPPGAMLYLEAQDLSGLLSDWNASREKSSWLGSPAYESFSRSRLLTRLEQLQTDFATAAGVPPDYAMLNSVAGAESALALYDIGKAELLFLTRLSAARAGQSLLWQQRTTAQSRRFADTEYFVKTDRTTGKTAAFAAAGGWLVVATREDLLTGALALIAGQSRAALRQERWFDLAIANAANARRELRLVANMDRLGVSPQFRTYWIQGNIKELRQFRSGVADLERSGGVFTERRVLLRGAPAADLGPAENGVAQILRLAPPDVGLYRAWAAPSPAFASSLIAELVFGGLAPGKALRKSAPGAVYEPGAAGAESDLESRIDLPPLVDDRQPASMDAIASLARANAVQAALHIGANRTQADGVYAVGAHAVALQGASDWDAAAVRNLLTTAAAGLFGAGQSAIGWQSRRAGGSEYFELNGVGRISYAISGRTLIAADSADMLRRMLSRLAAQPGAAAAYAAAYRHAAEWPAYERMMRLIDFPLTPAAEPGQTREPPFFSGIVGSLGRVASRLESASVSAHDNGAQLSETIVYRLR